MYIVIIVFYLKVELIINGNKQKLMIIKELFEGPEGGLLYCPQYYQMLVDTSHYLRSRENIYACKRTDCLDKTRNTVKWR